MSKSVEKMSEKCMKTMRAIEVFRGKLSGYRSKERAEYVYTLGMIIDLFLYQLKSIMPFSRMSVMDESNLSDDVRSLYTYSIDVFKKIERLFTKQLAALCVENNFDLLYDEVVVVAKLYSSIDYVTRYYDFSGNEELRTELEKFEQPDFTKAIYSNYTIPMFEVYDTCFTCDANDTIKFERLSLDDVHSYIPR